MREALGEMDMFNIMFNEYEPWVDIASEKFGHTQVRLIARQFAHMLDYRPRNTWSSPKKETKMSMTKKKIRNLHRNFE